MVSEGTPRSPRELILTVADEAVPIRKALRRIEVFIKKALIKCST
jgi:hypothetical protein